MEPRDKRNWESQWEEAFKNASEAPSPLVWKSIEASLANGNGLGKSWWLWVAAAFLGGVITTATMFFMIGDAPNKEMAKNIENKSAAELPTNISIDRFEKSEDLASNDASTTPSVRKSKRANLRSANTDLVGTTKQQLEGSESITTSLQTDNSIANVGLVNLNTIKPVFDPAESIAQADVKGVFIFDPTKFNPRESKDQNWLAGVSFSSGAFSQGSNGQMSLNDKDFSSSSPLNDGFVKYSNLAVSNSLGMNVGRRISNRWVISGGLGYQVTTNQSNSNMVLVNESDKADRNAVGELVASNSGFSAPAKEEYIIETTPDSYRMQNSYQFVSVPVSMGYFIIDKKWKLNLNAGVNTDFFYQYTSKAEMGNLKDYIVRPSDDESWKYLNISIAGGLEVSRVLADNYLLALAPGYRHALSEFGVTGNNQLQPNVFHVTLKFNYIF